MGLCGWISPEYTLNIANFLVSKVSYGSMGLCGWVSSEYTLNIANFLGSKGSYGSMGLCGWISPEYTLNIANFLVKYHMGLWVFVDGSVLNKH